MRRCDLFRLLGTTLAWATCAAGMALADTPTAGEATLADNRTAAERGFDFLLHTPTIPPDFHQEDFDHVWRVWPEPLRSEAERATPAERRRLAFERYGLTNRPGRDDGPPLQYVVRPDGGWVMNCFSCHGGQVAGQVIPGLPNSNYALQTLTEEMRAVKILRQRRLAAKDVGSLFFPLGSTRGTTNAVMFGVALMNYRDGDLNVVDRTPPTLTHHDMDAPPWWHLRHKQMLYIDAFAEKSPRALMQFMLVRSNGPDHFHQLEGAFADVLAYLESLEPPAYPYELDRSLADRGRIAFQRVCAECHGTYGPSGEYPRRVVPIEQVGTSRVRLDALAAWQRQAYNDSWFGEYGRKQVVAEPGGYLAPPLTGVWASAPYLHNGSVPTLWHLLHPDERPVVWKRTATGYDRQRVGLEIETWSTLPREVDSPATQREYFDTRRFGKSAAGHRFPDELSPAEKRAVLEYLKTL